MSLDAQNSRTAGLNFLFDKDVRADQRVAVFMRNTTIQDAVNQLMVTNQLEQRILDAATILIYPNNAAKARDIITDDKLNMIVMRDTPESVRLAERLIVMHDVQEPEVMLEVEVMEVSRTRLTQVGVRFPDSLTSTPLANAAGNITVESLRQINQAAIGVTGATLGVAARKTDAGTNGSSPIFSSAQSPIRRVPSFSCSAIAIDCRMALWGQLAPCSETETATVIAWWMPSRRPR